MAITIPDTRSIQFETDKMHDRFYGFTLISIIVPKYNNADVLETVLKDAGFKIHSKESIVLESKDVTADVETFLTVQAHANKGDLVDPLVETLEGVGLPAFILDTVDFKGVPKLSTVARNLEYLSDYIDLKAVSVIKDPTKHTTDQWGGITYAMHTSRAGLALLTGPVEHVIGRQSAVGYIDVRSGGSAFGRTFKEAIESDELITTPIHRYPPLKVYRIALIANTYLKLYGQLNAATLESIINSYHALSPIASAVDTKLDWDGVSNLPIPASRDELDKMFKSVLDIKWEENLVI